MLRLALEPFEDETWGGAFGSTAEDCERLRSLLLVEVAKGLSEGPADGAGSPAGDDDGALCAYCGGEGRGVPVNWVVDVADHALTWFLGTAFEYLERDRRVRVAIPDLDRPVWSGLVALDRRALRLVECCDDASRALYGCLCRASCVDVDWRVRARPAPALEGDAKEAPGEAPTGTATRYARLAHAVLLDGRKVRIDDAFTVLECVDGFSDFEQLVVDGALQYAGGKDSARKAARRDKKKGRRKRAKERADEAAAAAEAAAADAPRDDAPPRPPAPPTDDDEEEDDEEDDDDGGGEDALLRVRCDCAATIERTCEALRASFLRRLAREREAHDRDWERTERLLVDELDARLRSATAATAARFSAAEARARLRGRAEGFSSDVPPPLPPSAAPSGAGAAARAAAEAAATAEQLRDAKDELELMYMTYNPTLHKQRESQQRLVDARDAALAAARDHPAAGLEVKVMGQLDPAALASCGMGAEEISVLQERLRHPEFHPTKVVVEGDVARERADREHPELVALRFEYGEVAVDEVLRCFQELDEWNPSGRYSVSVPWDVDRDVELQPADVIARLAAASRPRDAPRPRDARRATLPRRAHHDDDAYAFDDDDGDDGRGGGPLRVSSLAARLARDAALARGDDRPPGGLARDYRGRGDRRSRDRPPSAASEERRRAACATALAARRRRDAGDRGALERFPLADQSAASRRNASSRGADEPAPAPVARPRSLSNSWARASRTLFGWGQSSSPTSAASRSSPGA